MYSKIIVILLVLIDYDIILVLFILLVIFSCSFRANNCTSHPVISYREIGHMFHYFFDLLRIRTESFYVAKNCMGFGILIS